MTLNDIQLLIKKILVGLLVYIIPAVLIISGLLFIANTFQRNTPPLNSSTPINEDFR